MATLDQDTLCVLCQKPMGKSGMVQYMGNLGRDMWAHKACYQERYHPRAQVEPKEQQGEMELIEEPA